MKEELKPCPFCGSNDLDLCYVPKSHWVSCNVCNAEGPNGNYSTVKKAIAAWNKRIGDGNAG
jgi:Lar family restriction alleviation protein